MLPGLNSNGAIDKDVVFANVQYTDKLIPKSTALIEMYGKIDELRSAINFTIYYLDEECEQMVQDHPQLLDPNITTEEDSFFEALHYVIMLAEEIQHPITTQILDDITYITKSGVFDNIARVICFENRFPHYDKLYHMSDKLGKMPKLFAKINSRKNEASLWLNESRVCARSLERSLVKLYNILMSGEAEASNRIDCFLYIIGVVNELSNVLFKANFLIENKE